MSTVDRSSPPPPRPLRSFSFPPVTRHRLDTGLAVEVIRMPRLPVATALLMLPAGEDALGDSHAGLAGLAGDALEGGTAHRSGADFAEALERLGADLDAGAGWNATTVGLSCLADRFTEAMGLLAEMVLEPAFPEDEVVRMRDQRLARIQQRGKDPSAMCADLFHREIYADGEVYGRPQIGTTESLSSFGPATLRGFAEARYRPRGGSLVVAGDVADDEVLALARDVLGGWTGEPPAREAPKGTARAGARRIVVQHRPGSVQSTLQVGHTGVPRKVAGYESLVVSLAVLGGTFSSRLNLNLREKHGFTYGIRARMGYRRGPGPFTIATAVDTDVTAAAVREIVHEVTRYVEDGPDHDEVASARDYLAGIFPLRLETTAQVASRVSELLLFDLPQDTWAGYRDRIRAVTAGSAHEAARKHVRPDELAICVVGDADAVVPELEALGLGPVEVRE